MNAELIPSLGDNSGPDATARAPLTFALFDLAAAACRSRAAP